MSEEFSKVLGDGVKSFLALAMLVVAVMFLYKDPIVFMI